MDPTPKDLKAKRHRALIRAIDEMCDQLRRIVSDPAYFDETEAELWTDEFFRAARCDPQGLVIQGQLQFYPGSSIGTQREKLNSGTIGRHIIDREVFADTARWEHERNEMWETWLRAKTPELDVTERPNAPGPNKAGNEHK